MEGLGTFYFVQSTMQAGENARLRKENEALKKALGGDESALQALTTEPVAAVEPSQATPCEHRLDLLPLMAFILLIIGACVFVKFFLKWVRS